MLSGRRLLVHFPYLGITDWEHVEIVRVWGEDGFFGARRHCVKQDRGIGEISHFVLLVFNMGSYVGD